MFLKISKDKQNLENNDTSKYMKHVVASAEYKLNP